MTEGKRHISAGRREGTAMVFSSDPDLFESVRSRIESLCPELRTLQVTRWNGANEAALHSAPRIIVIDEEAVADPGMAPFAQREFTKAVVCVLAGHAPLIVFGSPELRRELAELVSAGAADCFARDHDGIAAGLAALGRRLFHAEDFRDIPRTTTSLKSQGDFGELLRHELNNPLTGILGNAELLLRDLRKVAPANLPRSAERRLETIAALSVRMRETVRRLSTAWENQAETEPEPAGRPRS